MGEPIREIHPVATESRSSKRRGVSRRDFMRLAVIGGVSAMFPPKAISLPAKENQEIEEITSDNISRLETREDELVRVVDMSDIRLYQQGAIISETGETIPYPLLNIERLPWFNREHAELVNNQDVRLVLDFSNCIQDEIVFASTISSGLEVGNIGLGDQQYYDRDTNLVAMPLRGKFGIEGGHKNFSMRRKDMQNFQFMRMFQVKGDFDKPSDLKVRRVNIVDLPWLSIRDFELEGELINSSKRTVAAPAGIGAENSHLNVMYSTISVSANSDVFATKGVDWHNKEKINQLLAAGKAAYSEGIVFISKPEVDIDLIGAVKSNNYKGIDHKKYVGPDYSKRFSCTDTQIRALWDGIFIQGVNIDAHVFSSRILQVTGKSHEDPALTQSVVNKNLPFPERGAGIGCARLFATSLTVGNTKIEAHKDITFFPMGESKPEQSIDDERFKNILFWAMKEAGDPRTFLADTNRLDLSDNEIHTHTYFIGARDSLVRIGGQSNRVIVATDTAGDVHLLSKVDEPGEVTFIDKNRISSTQQLEQQEIMTLSSSFNNLLELKGRLTIEIPNQVYLEELSGIELLSCQILPNHNSLENLFANGQVVLGSFEQDAEFKAVEGTFVEKYVIHDQLWKTLIAGIPNAEKYYVSIRTPNGTNIQARIQAEENGPLGILEKKVFVIDFPI